MTIPQNYTLYTYSFGATENTRQAFARSTVNSLSQCSIFWYGGFTKKTSIDNKSKACEIYYWSDNILRLAQRGIKPAVIMFYAL